MATNSGETHSHIDPVFKQILEDTLIPMKAGVQTEVEINRLPLKIDAIITVDTEEARQIYRMKHRFSTSSPVIK